MDEEKASERDIPGESKGGLQEPLVELIIIWRGIKCSTFQNQVQ